MVRKIFVSLTIGLFFFTWYSIACTRIAISDEEERIRSDLIVTAILININQKDQSHQWALWYNPDTLYTFNIEETFKWDISLTGFYIEDESNSSCSFRLEQWWKYLLYLIENSEKPNFYYSYQPPTLIKPTKYPVIPISNPLWNTKRYITYYNIKKDLFHTRRDIIRYLENKWYEIQAKIDYYKVKYGLY